MDLQGLQRRGRSAARSGGRPVVRGAVARVCRFLCGLQQWRLGVWAGALLVAVAGCGGSPGRGGDGRPLVVTTTTVITDLVRELAGERVRVVGIIPPGMNPHTYEPRPDDSVLMHKAALILYNGLHLEGKMVHMFENAGTKTVALAEDPRIVTRGSVEYEGAPDPHCWWNPRYFLVFAERARDALIGVDPAGREYYTARAAAYVEKLKEADAQIRAAIARIPPQRRYLITSHDAFYYYGEAYGLRVDAVLGISTDADVQPLRAEELARLVTRNGVPAVFHETAVSAALNEMVNRIVELAAQHGHTVRVASEPLYSDSLDEPGQPAGTYLGALRENTRIIASALAGVDVSDLLKPKGE